ncbi:MAG: carboxymuconolactone decarboxylase family protein [Syntrophotalea acetylenica]|nr:carboxymuconolactone decarboxylase family protein [Syntrophotalea acetylenica]
MLSPREQAIVAMAAFTANGELERLGAALNQGLDTGLTVNEVKEILVQMYAYAGFPRSLGAIGVLMGVVEERRARGIQDEEGRDASPTPDGLDRDTYGDRVRAELAGLDEGHATKAPYQEFAPIIDTFLKEHLFADIFVRDVLTHQERELATIACLAALGGVEGPLAFHMAAAMNTGLSGEQMSDFVRGLDACVGPVRAESARRVLVRVVAER